MIDVIKAFKGKSPSDGYAGDLTRFLSSLFLEVATEKLSADACRKVADL